MNPPPHPASDFAAPENDSGDGGGGAARLADDARAAAIASRNLNLRDAVKQAHAARRALQPVIAALDLAAISASKASVALEESNERGYGPVYAEGQIVVAGRAARDLRALITDGADHAEAAIHEGRQATLPPPPPPGPPPPPSDRTTPEARASDRATAPARLTDEELRAQQQAHAAADSLRDGATGP